MGDIETIRRRLARLRGNIATALALDGAARVAGALLAAVATSFLLDRVFKLEVPARAVLLLAGLGALAWVAWRFLVRRLGGLPGEDPLAVAVEARHPQLRDRLISAIQLSREKDPERYGMSPQLVADAVHEALGPVADVRFRDVLATGRILRVAALGALALVLLAGGAAADPESAGIWFQRNVLLRDVRWPQKTYLEIDPDRFPNGVASIVRGSDLVVVARSAGEVHPEKVTILFEDSEGDSGEATMKADMQSLLYRHEFKEVAFPITFHLEGGDDVTDKYRIELLEPPEVSELGVEVGFPEYAGREPETIDLAAGDPEVLRGGFLVVRGRSSKPLEAAELVLGESEESALAARLTGEDAFEIRYDQPDGTVLAGVRLRDVDGLTNPSLSPRFLVRVVDDRAPRVRLHKAGVGALVVAGAVVPYRVRAHDDVRVVAGRIEVKKSASGREAPEPHVVPLPEDSLGGESLEIEGELELGPLELNPGAFLTLHAFAKDNAQPEAHEGKSDPVTLKVVTMEELFNDLRRRQQEQRRLFEELIKREERLRDRFLDLRDTPPPATELEIQLESEAQDQREIARRVHAIERAFDQILDEMLYNRLAEPGQIASLRNDVVRALRNLRTRTMDGHAKHLDESARRAEEFALRGQDGDEVEQGYERVLASMRAVLARMIKSETFVEIVESLQDLVTRHGKVREGTRKRYEAVLKDLFGPDEDENK